jgi:hypothetical protein
MAASGGNPTACPRCKRYDWKDDKKGFAVESIKAAVRGLGKVSPLSPAFDEKARVVVAALETVARPVAVIEDDEVDLCKHTEWGEDGEQYGCRLPLGHKGTCARGGRVS